MVDVRVALSEENDRLIDENTALRAEVDRLMDVIAQLQEIVNSDTAEEERIRAENERLNKSRNKWGQKYNKLLEEHKVTRAEMANQIQWVKDLADNLIAEEAKTSALRAEVEKLRAALGEIVGMDEVAIVEWKKGDGWLHQRVARAALEGK